MVNSLRKVDFFAPYWILCIILFAPPPLEKILGAPLFGHLQTVGYCVAQRSTGTSG